jgi:hypothetical protein
MSAFRTGKLYCYILRKSQSSFHVNIADCATVSELKEKILLKNQNSVVGVDEHQLKIWKVCAFELLNLKQLLRADKHYMSTKDLKTQLANLQLCDDSALDGAVLLSSEFSDACLGQIHVIAEVSDGEYPIISFLSMLSGLLVTLQVSPLVRNVAWVVPTPLRFLITLASGNFFGRRFGGIQLPNVSLKALPLSPIREHWKRQLRK